MNDKDIAEVSYINGFEEGVEAGRKEALKEVWALIWKTPMLHASTKASLLYDIQEMGEGYNISVEDIIDEHFKKEVIGIARAAIDLVRTVEEKVEFLKDAYEIKEEDL